MMVEQDEKPKPGDIVSLTTDDNRLVIKSIDYLRVWRFAGGPCVALTTK
jgi:hypothetical protein